MRRIMTLLLITAGAFTLALGSNPRYVEELCVGGGQGDPVNGGATLEASGAIRTDADVTALNGFSGGDVRVGQGRALQLRLNDAACHSVLRSDSPSDDLILGANDAAGNPAFRLRLRGSSADRMVVTSAGATVNGVLNVTGALSASPGGDSTHALGRASLGYDAAHGDAAVFAHEDRMNGTAFALMQEAAGATTLNAATGQALRLRIGNDAARQLSLNSDGNCTATGQFAAEGGLRTGKDLAEPIRLFRDVSQSAAVVRQAFAMKNAASPTPQEVDYGAITCSIGDPAAAQEDGALNLLVRRNGALVAGAIANGSTGVFSTSLDAHVDGGDLEAGLDSSERGVVTAWDGSGGNKPGCIRLASPNGGLWYLFIADDGTVRVSPSLPASNSDGVAIGGQS